MPVPQDGVIPGDPSTVIDQYKAAAQAAVDAAQEALAAAQARVERAQADLTAKQEVLASYESYPKP